MSDIVLPLTERGYFWWADEPVPADRFVPDDGVYGTFTLQENGACAIDLDGVMPGPGYPFDRALQRDQSVRSIAGVLIRPRSHVLLIDTQRNGSHGGTNSFSYERREAFTCLIRGSRFLPQKNVFQFRYLEVPLQGFQDWLGGSRISVKVSRQNRARVTRTRQESFNIRLHDGRFKIEFDVGVTYEHSPSSNIIVYEKPYVTYHFNKKSNVTDAIDFHRGFEDLLMLLTNSEQNLHWPRIRLRPSDEWVTVYYQRAKRKETQIEWLECWTILPHILKDFDLILHNWREKFSESKPEFYLYTGNRRGRPMYTEHKFINLVWGLEALHRTLTIVENNSALESKIVRVSKAIDESALNSNDRRWAKRQINHVPDIRLEDRLSQIINGLPIRFTPESVATFCNTCAERRNSLSHHGGARPDAESREFMKDVARIGYGLDVVYHIKLLQTLGLTDRNLLSLVTTKFVALQVRGCLEHAGLVLETPLNG